MIMYVVCSVILTELINWMFLLGITDLHVTVHFPVQTKKSRHIFHVLVQLLVFVQTNDLQQIVRHFIFSVLLLLLTWLTLLPCRVCAIKKTIYTHGHTQHSPTKMCMLHVLYTCVSVQCSSSPIAPGEIYEVLRKLAWSSVMGDWSHLLACPCPGLTPHLKTHTSTNRRTFKWAHGCTVCMYCICARFPHACASTSGP